MSAEEALGKQWWVDGHAGPGTGATAALYKVGGEENTYELTRLQKGYDARPGVGRQLLDKIHGAADEHGATIQAHLLPDIPKLTHFYQAAGYEVTHPSVPPFGGPRLRRTPRPKQ